MGKFKGLLKALKKQRSFLRNEIVVCLFVKKVVLKGEKCDALLKALWLSLTRVMYDVMKLMSLTYLTNSCIGEGAVKRGVTW